ncbi:MAG: DUF192 domain-containing protein [Gammaproteobacteria bacterium]|nr:DUF192 domain-containing protein [Gammaproteobacteria bacterium]MBU1554832.1 DUF192 domain-containing protein [Gammaproteobacteria bacterium]MBU2070087.1 DUF192 domain-containing protein [Gammaproteobacteria bacterium]MBU2183617.1 DUF192 domain-containing protein [Gammaproteobacteria bacterium]MBU2205621.1 DUF192 domain-containing protein [Gammaproteobacteria bacterium]
MINRLIVMLALLLPLMACAAEQPRESFSLVALQLGDRQIQVQLADTPEKRAQGLMFQQSAEPGMLLLYREPTAISLWMANTSMALDVAYIGADWTVAELITLEPFDKTPVPSQQPVIAALEMPRGWFARHGVTLGQQVALLPDATR